MGATKCIRILKYTQNVYFYAIYPISYRDPYQILWHLCIPEFCKSEVSPLFSIMISKNWVHQPVWCMSGYPDYNIKFGARTVATITGCTNQHHSRWSTGKTYMCVPGFIIAIGTSPRTSYIFHKNFFHIFYFRLWLVQNHGTVGERSEQKGWSPRAEGPRTI